jgi:hypothetical protein
LLDPPENTAELVFVSFLLLDPLEFRRTENPAELVFVLYFLLDPPEKPAELVFVLLLLLDPPDFTHPPITIH